VAARKQGNQQMFDDLVLPDDALADLGTQGAAGLAKLAGGGDIALDHLGRGRGGCVASHGSARKNSHGFL
jgi:hypothetical protein